jgi:hypothetical protein
LIHKYPRKSWEVLEVIGHLCLNWVPGVVLEIGSGTTTPSLHDLAVEFDREFHSCDLYKNPIGLKKRYKLTNRYKPFKGTSDDFAKQFNKKIAFAFIDGCHLYDYIRRDFFFVYGLLNPGGIVCMHDTLPPSEKHAGPGQCQDAYKLRLELEKREDIEIISWPYPNYYGISMVIKKQRFWLPPEEKI